MTFKPTETQRSVLLAIKFTNCGDAQENSHSIETMRVTAISTLFADCDTTTVEIFSDQNEAALLRRFWLSLRTGDRVFAADIEVGLTIIRLRSWALGVLPSLEINLSCVYGLQLVDTGEMWASGGDVPYPLFTEEPDSEIEFEVPFDDAFDEVTVHSREETVHSRD